MRQLVAGIALSAALLLGNNCHLAPEPVHILLGDSYNVLGEPYFVQHSRCETVSLAIGGRSALEVLDEDVDQVEAIVAGLVPTQRPVVILSAGLIDEIVTGDSELVAARLQTLGEALLAVREDLILLQLGYSIEGTPLPAFAFVDFDVSPRWRLVPLTGIVHNEFGPDGLHLVRAGYVERFIAAARQHPHHLLCPPVFDSF